MATQGLVTVQKSGRVIMKVVAGCNGYQAQRLARRMRRAWPLSVDEVHDMALRAQFGEPGCLVVITRNAARFEGGDRLNRRYRATFTKPRFNPRWRHGTADHIAIVNVRRDVAK